LLFLAVMVAPGWRWWRRRAAARRRSAPAWPGTSRTSATRPGPGCSPWFPAACRGPLLGDHEPLGRVAEMVLLLGAAGTLHPAAFGRCLTRREYHPVRPTPVSRSVLLAADAGQRGRPSGDGRLRGLIALPCGGFLGNATGACPARTRWRRRPGGGIWRPDAQEGVVLRGLSISTAPRLQPGPLFQRREAVC